MSLFLSEDTSSECDKDILQLFFEDLNSSMSPLKISYHYIRWRADKSLARPGRKEATVTKLGIYSTYSPRSSIQVLDRCPNFCKPIKKNFRRLSVQPGLRSCNDLSVGQKMATFQLFFSVQGTGGSPTGPDPESRLGDQETGSPGRPFFFNASHPVVL